MVRYLLRIGVSVALLAALLWWIGTGALVERLSGLRVRWVVLAIASTIPQLALSAFRWRLTAGRLGVGLPLGQALREYYLATFLNQVLPGGVVGDVSRAWRHARAGDGTRTGVAARAVILERASGQAVVGAVALLSLAALPLGTASPLGFYSSRWPGRAEP